MNSASEEQAMLLALNELIIPGVGGLLSDDPVNDFRQAVTAHNALSLFQLVVMSQTASFQPLVIDRHFSWPEMRYNFQSTGLVVYHPEFLEFLFLDIFDMSGTPEYRMDWDGPITRARFAAFATWYSFLSLPSDPSGRWPGAVSGSELVDTFISDILERTVMPGMSDLEQIRAVYDYMVLNFRHDSYSMPIFIGATPFESDHTPIINPLMDARNFAMPLIMTG